MTSLYSRMREHGTLTEAPRDIPDAVFALPSTLNWMRAQAILVTELSVDFRSARTFYQKVQRKDLPERQLNSVLEQLLFSLNQIAALKALATVPNKADVARVGIVTWYYGVYGAASAMIAANDGSFPETHAATATQWDRQFAVTGLAMPPFADRLGSLVAARVKQELIAPKARGTHSLTTVPTTLEQAWGCHAEYLSGTAGWEQWNVEQRVRQSTDFRALGVDSFRTKAARELRDGALGKRSISFLHEASRYRGKANYRDAIYLAYGRSVPKLVDGFIDDLEVVLRAFSAMAAGYCSLRMGRDRWQEYVDDLEERRAISLSPGDVWF
ncbi:hypothetical protein [Sphingomonas glacialis]|uniref:Uncharacterized protein n=1 Tax=Sphingomonas glacialis TaxID=658225 RepID=A0A502FRL6_9SPHN|nr:hypothetical protein [Sphingomonas glacialis]TPG52051.1 hypothetical protein EAH76_15135 [Sphingomonas glacialis]